MAAMVVAMMMMMMMTMTVMMIYESASEFKKGLKEINIYLFHLTPT